MSQRISALAYLPLPLLLLFVQCLPHFELKHRDRQIANPRSPELPCPRVEHRSRRRFLGDIFHSSHIVSLNPKRSLRPAQHAIWFSRSPPQEQIDFFGGLKRGYAIDMRSHAPVSSTNRANGHHPRERSLVDFHHFEARLGPQFAQLPAALR